MSDVLDIAINNPDLPLDLPLFEQIKALPGLTNWFQIALDTTTLDGTSLITTVTDLMPGGATLSQGTAGRRPGQTAQIAGYPAATFDGVDDQFVLSVPFSATNPFTIVLMGRFPTPAAQGCAVSTYSATNVGSYIALRPDGQVEFAHGTGKPLVASHASGSPEILILSTDTAVTKGRVNGGATVSAATNNAGGTTLRFGVLNSGGGQPLAMAVTDVLIFNRDVLADIRATRLIEQYAALNCGVTLLS